MLQVFLGIALLSFETLAALQLPPEIRKCSLSDPKIEDCLTNTITNSIKIFGGGSKDFGIPALEPLEIQKLEIEAEPGKSVNLNQLYENVKMYGLTDSKVVKFRKIADNKTCRWEMEIHTPMSRMEADYKLTGQILIFPINGFGKCNVTLYNIINYHTIDCDRYMKKGKMYEKLKNYKMDMKVTNCVFQFENLFPGNQQISSELEKTINENSLAIFEEVKHGFEEVLSRLHENAANGVLSRIPLDELYLP